MFLLKVLYFWNDVFLLNKIIRLITGDIFRQLLAYKLINLAEC